MHRWFYGASDLGMKHRQRRRQGTYGCISVMIRPGVALSVAIPVLALAD
ncbi:hypothetical protein KCP75_00990 [Salmonella enterica subsp. enterica]|nr:hypothetical protein KCP75_00990 [Salmonella enterica subsp. enterica]